MKVERLKKWKYALICENEMEEDKLEAFIRGVDGRLLGIRDKKTYRIDLSDIF